MKLLEMLNVSKAHLVRIILCSICTMAIIIVVGIINRVFMYIFARWTLDVVSNNLEGSVPFEVIVVVILWNYIIGFVVIGLMWKYLGLPKTTVIGKVYKSYMDMYYEDDDG